MAVRYVNCLPVNGLGTVSMDAVGAIVPALSRFDVPYTAADTVAVTVDGAVASEHNGYAFDAAGRLLVTKVNPVVGFHQGFARDAADRVAVQTVSGAGPVHNGGAFDTAGLLFVSGI